MPVLIFFGPLFAYELFWYLQMRKVRDREWEREWKTLPLRTRAKVVRSIRRADPIIGPFELKLVLGAAEQQRQMFTGPTLDNFFAVLGAGEIVIGAVSGSLSTMGVGVFTVAVALIFRVYRRRLLERIAVGEAAYRAALSS